MICPNMATMLMFLTTDAAITPEMLQKAVSADVKDSLNMLSVDRDTSTNDTLCVLASGLAGNPVIERKGRTIDTFCRALHTVTTAMCKKLAADGEGATKLIECRVRGAKTKEDARLAAKSVVNSNLVKAAMFGADANWGRVLCALGYAGADLDPDEDRRRLPLGGGQPSRLQAGQRRSLFGGRRKARALRKGDRHRCRLNGGAFEATAWGCDLTYDYVKINGDYRT